MLSPAIFFLGRQVQLNGQVYPMLGWPCSKIVTAVLLIFGFVTLVISVRLET
jgi:hypothetical protein